MYNYMENINIITFSLFHQSRSGSFGPQLPTPLAARPSVKYRPVIANRLGMLRRNGQSCIAALIRTWLPFEEGKLLDGPHFSKSGMFRIHA
jgi:hypothetical protein